MNKFVLAAVAVAAIGGSAYTLNALAETDATDAPQAHRVWDGGFILDAKLAGMKAALNLTSDQEKLWPAFELAVRDAHKARMEAMRQQREAMEKDGERPSPIDMMNRLSDRLAKASDELKKVADAAQPLYASLDDTQKRHFGPLLMMMRQGGGHHHWSQHEERDPEHL